MGLSWAFWGLLGPSLAVLGRLGVVWGRLKFDVKIDQKIDTFQDRFLTRCWWILGRKWRQVGTRIYQKSDHKLTSYQKCRTGLRYYKNHYFFNRNGVLEVQASIKNRPKIDQKSINIEAWRGSGRILATKRVLKGVLGFLGGLLGRLGGLLGRLGSKKLAHMAPTWLPKRSQNR